MSLKKKSFFFKYLLFHGRKKVIQVWNDESKCKSSYVNHIMEGKMFKYCVLIGSSVIFVS